MIIHIISYLFLLFAFVKTRKYFIFSPVDIFVLFFSSVLVLSISYHHLMPEQVKFNFFNFDLIKTKNLIKTITVYLSMLIFFILGYLFFFIKDKKYRDTVKHKINIPSFDNTKLNNKTLPFVLILLFSFSAFLVFLDYGFELFQRSNYIPKKDSSYKTIYQLLFIVVSLIAAVIYKSNKFLSIFIVLGITIMTLGIGSRYASINLLLFGIILSMSINYKKRYLFYLFFIPFIVLFFGYNIALRSESNGHGLIPYLKVTFQKPDVILKYTFKNIYYTFIFGFYATSETLIHYRNPNLHKLYSCLSPLPGFMTDWYMYAKNMRLNIYAPYTSIGEISCYSVASYIYYFIMGYYFTFIDKFIKIQFLLKKYVFALLLFLTLLIFMVLSFEYNLRSSNRYLYYSYFIYIIAVISKIKIKSNAKN